MLKGDLGEDFEVACIGPAGENVVSFACIGHDFGRQAGRCGIGAVMGSKRLKAIAVRGTGSVPIHDLPALKDFTMGVIKRTSQHPNMAPWQKYGTAMFVGWSNEHGVYPTHNFQTTFFDRYAGIDGQPLVDRLLVSNKACFGCWMNCGKYSQGAAAGQGRWCTWRARSTRPARCAAATAASTRSSRSPTSTGSATRSASTP